MSTKARAGQPAKTRYRVIERAGNRAAWVELQPLTGRTHQLRVHMLAIGHPILGDGKYGGQDAFLTGAISRKLHLHARRLQDRPSRRRRRSTSPPICPTISPRRWPAWASIPRSATRCRSTKRKRRRREATKAKARAARQAGPQGRRGERRNRRGG